MLDCERPGNFRSDNSFVAFMEKEAKKICGAYLLKEQVAKDASLGSRRRLNRVFDLMNVTYADWPVLGDALVKEVGTSASAVGRSSKSFGRAGSRHTIRELDLSVLDVKL